VTGVLSFALTFYVGLATAITLPVPGGNGGSGDVGLATAITLPVPGGNGGNGDVGLATAITLPVPGGNGGNGDVGLATAITLPVPGGNGGNGDVGLVTKIDPVPCGTCGSEADGPANAETAVRKAKLAKATVVRILTKLADIVVDLLGVKKKLSW
jgi:hypothetical protein